MSRRDKGGKHACGNCGMLGHDRRTCTAPTNPDAPPVGVKRQKREAPVAREAVGEPQPTLPAPTLPRVRRAPGVVLSRARAPHAAPEGLGPWFTCCAGDVWCAHDWRECEELRRRRDVRQPVG